VGVIFAFAAAMASALNVVTQHVASTSARDSVKGWRLALFLVRNPLWLFGVGAVVVSFVCQAVALFNSRLSVVQCILVSELVFSLVIGRFWLHRRVRLAAWLSVCGTCLGLAVFLVVSEPKGGHPDATSAAWLPALLTFGGLAAICTAAAARGPSVRRGALYATASAIVSALLATFLKATTAMLVSDGVVPVLTHGEIYGLLAAVVAATFLTQAALHFGALSVSQAFMVIVNPLVSVVLGVWLYGEHFTGGALRLGVATIGFAAMATSVVFLSRTAPSLSARKRTEGAEGTGNVEDTASAA
jgi:hypothetical protein